MKKITLAIGCVLLITLLIGSGWLVISSKALAITTIECRLGDGNCPPRVAESIEQQLLGKPITITDFATVLSASEYQVIDFKKKLPSHLSVVVEPTDPRQVIGNIITSDHQTVTDSIAETLTAQGVTYTGIEVRNDQELVIIYLPAHQALLSLRNINQDLTTLLLIQKHLSLAEIDNAIVEIDVRYQMPVLRTVKSF